MKVAHLSEPAEERVIFRDGLGVREWRDTGPGERVEWFHLDAAFAGAEAPLRDRVTRLAKLQHVKFSRILTLHPARKGAGPILVSSHIPGTRFSEVLEMAAHGLVTVEPATAVQITREVVGALGILHDSRNVTHGALAPERLVLTASGRVVVVEHALSSALDRLSLPRHQLWRDWRIATPPSAGQMRFDVRTDLAQLGLLALAAMLGRPIDQEEYPHRLRGLLPLAQDKLARSPLAAIAPDLVAWLERLVPVESRRAFTSVKEAQTAFEAFVSARATSMIIAPARVKGLMSAVAALSAAATPTVSAEATSTATPGPVASVTTAPSPTAPAGIEAPPTQADDDIDIDALLRLEAELEGGSAVSRPAQPPAPAVAAPVPVAAAPPPPPAEAVAVPAELDQLEQERADLERRFAELVEAVAPGAASDEAPVRLRPETPDTVDVPLVDPLVRWSSMPAGDLPETPESTEQDSPAATVVDLAEDVVAETAAPEPVSFAFEPLVIAVPEEPAPSAALDHVPTEWWREALPWRDEQAVETTAPAEDAPAAAGLALEVADQAPQGAVVSDDPVPPPLVVEAAGEAATEPSAEAIETPTLVAEEPAGIVAVDVPADTGAPAADAPETWQVTSGATDADDASGLVEVVEAAYVVVEADTPVPDEIAGAELASAPEAPIEPEAIAAMAVDVAVGASSFDLEVLDEVTSAGSEPLPLVTDDVLQPAVLIEPEVEETAAQAVELVSPLEEMASWHVTETSPAGVGADHAIDVPVAELDVPEPQVAVDACVAEAAPEPELDVQGEPAIAVADVPPVDLASEPEDADATEESASVLATAPQVGADIPAGDHAAARSSLFGDFVDLRLQQEEPEVAASEGMPSLRPTFAFLQADSTPVTAAASLLARAADLAVPAESSWRTAFAGDTPVVPMTADGEEVVAEAPEALGALAEIPTATEACEAVATEVIVSVDAGPTSYAVAESTPAPDPVAEPAGAMTPVPLPEPVSDPVPEVVIVDGGEDRDAFDTLTPEVPPPAAVVDAAPVLVSAAESVPSDADGDDEELDATSAAALAVPSSVQAPKKKRRRSRRKKAPASMPPEVVVAPAVRLDAAPADPIVSAPRPDLPSPGASGATPIAPELAEGQEEKPLVARRSLLEREVPTWTPPADLSAVARVSALRPAPAPVPEPAPPPSDEWGTGAFPASSVAGEATLPAPPAVSLPTRTVRQAMPIPVDPPRAEEPIRAVGMPDLEEFGLSSGRVALTSMADAIGPSAASVRQSSEPRPVTPTHLSTDTRRGWDWRRLIAASVLIALFNGAAFAAWWWVQPGARGTLVVQTAQPGVEVLLDGKLLGKTPFKEQVSPGRHKLTLRQGLSVREMPVEISLGVVTTQALDWPAADGSARGNLQVSSTPAGAEILIDGKSLGKAPLLLEDLPVGNLQMTLRGDAGSVTVTATVIAGETTPLDVPIFAGWVVVDAPLELSIVLKGARIGASTDGQILLSPGRHQLEAVNEALGFRKSFGVLIEPGEVRRVAITVPPGTLQVQDEPGSEVFVDGERVGSLPGVLRIPLGTHDVLVRRPDQSERRQTVTVRAGDTVSM